MKNFKPTELIKCYRERKQDRCAECRLTGPAHGLPNGTEANIESLVDNVLDPAREQFGKPIYVNSGFRCPLHNTTVGGVPKSQHIAGEAADITAGGLTAYGLPLTEDERRAENLKLAKIIAAQGKFDQIILYVNSSTSLEPRFIHVSYKRNGDNRHCILKQIAGQKTYTEVPSL